eukprot:8795614-Heterocapsa_arctica.AAC.1
MSCQLIQNIYEEHDNFFGVSKGYVTQSDKITDILKTMYDEDIEKAWTRDEKFELELASGYKTKEGEWDETHKTYAEELTVLTQANKVLNNNALDRFKNITASQPRVIKSIGGPSGE